MLLVLVVLLGSASTTAAAPPAVREAVLGPGGAIRWQAPSGAEERSLLKALPAARSDQQTLLVRFESKESESPSLTFSPGRPAAQRIVQVSRGQWLAAATVARGGSMRLGLADGSWETRGTQTLAHGLMRARTGQGFVRMVRPDLRLQGKTSVSVVTVDVAMPTDTTNAYRVQVLGKGGQPMPSAGANEVDASGDGALLFKGEFSAATKVLLQSRPYRWISLNR